MGRRDPAGTAICPQAAQHIFGTSTLAGPTPAASCRWDMLMSKHPMQIQEFCRDSQEQPLTHGAGFFPPIKPCSSPTSKRCTNACQTDLQHSLPGITFQSHPGSSPVLPVVSIQRGLSSKEAWIPQMLHVSHVSPTHLYLLISGAAGSTSTQVLISNPLFASGRAPQKQHQESAWEIPQPTTQYCG